MSRGKFQQRSLCRCILVCLCVCVLVYVFVCVRAFPKPTLNGRCVPDKRGWMKINSMQKRMNEWFIKLENSVMLAEWIGWTRRDWRVFFFIFVGRKMAMGKMQITLQQPKMKRTNIKLNLFAANFMIYSHQTRSTCCELLDDIQCQCQFVRVRWNFSQNVLTALNKWWAKS